jgi:outer membrane immunogenic protein
MTKTAKKAALLASVSPAAMALVGAANAADLPLKAPPAPVAAPAPFSWTGCYVGGQAGYGWGHNDPTRTHSQTFFFSSAPPSTTSASASAGIDPHGGVYGGQVGCNYQFASSWVFGVQGSLAGAHISGTVADPFYSPGTIGVNADVLGSVVARLGYTFWNNQLMLYVQGGGAGVEDKWTSTAVGNFTEDRLGWTVGAGLAWAFTPQWSVFGEYNHYGFPNGSTVTNANAVGGFPITATVDTLSTGKQTIDTVTFGVNYKFIGP